MELNELTKRLYAEGYTKESPPDYVRPFDSFYGGFTYCHTYLNKLVFETPCGLLIKGSHFINGIMSYRGIDWMPENNNPTVCCPRFSRDPCMLNHELLRGHCTCGEIIECACHLTDRTYDYEQSLDKVHDEVWKEAERLFQEFAASKHGRVCRQQSRYSRMDKRWTTYYDPIDCARRGYCRYCDVLQTYLSPEKGNVFYDLKISKTVKGIGLFPDERKTTIIKGEKLLDKTVSMTLCEAVVRYGKHRICKDIVSRRYATAVYHDPSMTVEVLNIRAQRRDTRDLMQDLRDAAEGMEIIHAGDRLKAAKQHKRERRQARQDSKVARLERLIVENGMSGLESIDQIRARKLLSYTRIRDLMRQHRQKLAQAKEEPAQLSLF